MCLVAEKSEDPIQRAEAQREVDWMVDENNRAHDRKEHHTMDTLSLYTEKVLDSIREDLMELAEGYYYAMETADGRLKYIKAIENRLMEARSRIPISAYKVICDSSNNTEETLARGEIHTDVYLQESILLDFKRISGVSGGHNPMSMIDFEIDLSSGSVTTNSGAQGGAQGIGSGNGPQSSANIGSVGPAGSIGGGSYGGSNQITITASQPIVSAMYGAIGTLSFEDPISKNPDLPGITFNTHDENDTPIKLHLRPEPTITAIEALRLMLMIQAYNKNPHAFSVYLHVKQQSLERHFKFEY